MQVQKRLYYSPEEYLAAEELADYKSEFYQGEVFAMVGGTIDHNQIIVNLCVALRLALKKSSCRIFASDVRLWIPHFQVFTYPDVMVLAGQPSYFENRRDTITNPLIIIEVLSKSTSNYDRGNKFAFYRTIPSFKEYLLIEQSKVHVEHFVQTAEKKWILSEYVGKETTIQLSACPLQLSLATVYEEVEFGESEL